LETLGEGDDLIVKVLADIFQNRKIDKYDRNIAGSALGSIARKNNSALSVLIKVLKDSTEDPGVRYFAATQLLISQQRGK
jgi:hypothetical protein